MRFSAVGIAASVTHYLMALALIGWGGWSPLVANAGGFAAAFWVSFAGHRFWTFRDSQVTGRESLPRFFLVALMGFGMNEALLFALLHFTPFPYPVSLALTIGVVAACTYLLSRRWAFKPGGG